MPIYRNRPDTPGDAVVSRYLGLDGLVATLAERKLRFTRIDKFEDPFEGSVPRSEADHVLPALLAAASGQNMMRQLAAHYPEMKVYDSEDAFTRVTRLRRARTKSAHASSWAAGEESELLWRLYCRDRGKPGLGVAMCTTLDRLERSVAAHDAFVSPILYVDYHTADGPHFNCAVDALFHKRRGFRDEREVRLLCVDDGHYGALARDATVGPLPEYRYFAWAAVDVLEAVVISPYADHAYEDEVRSTVAATAPALAPRVELSILHERRDAPRF